MTIPLSRILCPVDLSEFSRHALDHAVAMARWSGASVTALHVLQPMPVVAPITEGVVYPPILWTPEDLENVRRELADFVREECDRPIELLVRQGRPAEEIVRWAETTPADMIVLGTHGRSGFERLLLGSVTEKVLRKAPCAVLTVPPKSPDAVPAGPVLFRRILCAVDFSACSMKALEYAASLAAGAAARLTVLHVVEPLPDVMEGFALADYDLNVHERARTRLHESIPAAMRTDAVINEVVAEGKSYGEILMIAERDKTDLIVIGVHGRGAIDLAFFGSTANQLVRSATCPVLTLRN